MQNRELGESRSQDGNVLRALAPVAEKLTAVQQQVALLERDRLEQYGQLAQQLQEARLSDAQLIRSTHALESALRSNSARGQWGEVQLRRVVEASGMLKHVDFLEQVHSAGGDSTIRPDLVVQLPGQKQLVVDAKVPLSSYLEAQELGSGPGPEQATVTGLGAKGQHPSRRCSPPTQKPCAPTWTRSAARNTGTSPATPPSW